MLLLPSPRLGSRVLRCEPRCRSVAASSLRGGAEASGSDLLERPSKIMSRRGLASRRESERLMREGKVKVNGNVHRNPGDKIRADSSILIVGEEDLVRPSILLHKPVGVVSTQPDRRLKQVPAWELLTEENHDPGARDSSVVAREVTSEPWHMAVAGRLDKDSRGLLLMTQDGVLAKRVIGTKDVWKRYVVTVDEEPSKEQIRKLNTPMTLDGVRLKPMRVAPSLGARGSLSLSSGRGGSTRSAGAAPRSASAWWTSSERRSATGRSRTLRRASGASSPGRKSTS